MRIFISYRRSDEPYATQFLAEELAQHFGEENVFLDVDNIPIGVDFVDYLDQQVSQCNVMLVMIGTGWLDARYEDGPRRGERRLDDPEDFVRIEVTSALRRNIPVIPVLTRGTTMPPSSQLPEALQPLARINAAEVSYGRDLRSHVQRLIRGIEGMFPKDTVSEAEETSQSTIAPTASAPRQTPPPIRSFPLSWDEAKQYQSDWANWHNVPVEVTRGPGIRFVLIPPGTFSMGASTDNGEEAPDYQVTLSKSFYLSVTPLTQEQWSAILKHNPSYFKGEQRPVERVSWDDCQELCSTLQLTERLAFRLPTEAEWEYACRAGTITPFWFGETVVEAHLNCNLSQSDAPGTPFQAETTTVGTFSANPWGLLDVHGNVWEWCADWYGAYPTGQRTDPMGPSKGEFRVVRGGSWNNGPRRCRSHARFKLLPEDKSDAVGCRLCLTIG